MKMADKPLIRAALPSLLAAALLLLAGQSVRAAEREVDLELVLAADISGSMDLEEATLQRHGFASALRHPEVVQAIRLGGLGRIAVTYMEWAGARHQSTLVDWAEVSDATSATAFAQAILRPKIRTKIWTSISQVITSAAGSFANNGFQGLRRVIDISGDGPNNSGAFVVEARDDAVGQGITINGLPIINDRLGPYGIPPMPDLDLYYEDCVVGGPGAFVVVANGFGDFARAILRKMILEVAGARPRPRLLAFVAVGQRPPCNFGEWQIQHWLGDFD